MKYSIYPNFNFIQHTEFSKKTRWTRKFDIILKYLPLKNT